MQSSSKGGHIPTIVSIDVFSYVYNSIGSFLPVGFDMKKLTWLLGIFCFFFSLSVHPQPQDCATVAGGWTDNYGYIWSLSQYGGNVSGEVDTDCGRYEVYGQYSSGSLDLEASQQSPPVDCSAQFWYWGSLEAPGCNYGSGGWSNEDGLRGRWTWNKSCDKPTGEQTYYTEWTGTYLGFFQQLHPVTFPFEGRVLTEADAGNGGPDTCHFDGSLIAEQTVLTSGSPPYWPVYPGNVWGADYVGWDQASIEYYQFVRPMLGYPMPCGTTLRQSMKIACHQGYQAYRLNVLKATIGLFYVYSERDGVGGSENYPE